MDLSHKKKRRICVIGNFSGRNAGDAAILGGLLHDVSSRYPGCEFLVPTINPQFVSRTYKEYNVVPVGLLPWNLSIKIFGLPILRSVLSSDLVLVTDAILFDYRLFNPLYNYLSTMAIVLPMARKRGIPVVLYNVSLGPVYSKIGKQCLYRVLESSEILLLRDRESEEILPTLPANSFHDKVIESADCALNTVPGNTGRMDEIRDKEKILIGEAPWISLNISSYIDVYVRGYKGKGIGRDSFLDLVAEAADRIIHDLKVNIVVVITQPMDIPIAEQMLSRIRNRDRVRMISNKNYSYLDLALVFSRVEMHVGMRTHSLILASSALTPIVGIIATPKNRGYMRSIEQEERMVEFSNLTADTLFNALMDTWMKREQIRQELGPIIEREKEKASRAADHLAKFL